MDSIEFQPLTVLDLASIAGETAQYTNIPLSLVNDHTIRVSIMTEPFYWHYHPNSDETFLVIEEGIYIDLETHTIELMQGQLFSIPKNVKHRTRPRGQRSVNITFELYGIATIKVTDPTGSRQSSTSDIGG